MSPDARRYLIAAGLLVVAGVGVQLVRAWRVPEARYAVDFAAVPLQLGDFQGREIEVDEATRAYLKPDAMITRIYEGPCTAALSLIYATDWTQIHNPAGCFPAQGWLVLEDVDLDLPVYSNEGGQIVVHARRIHCRKGAEELLALFVFAYPGGTTSNWLLYATKVAHGSRGAGGLIIITQTSVEDSDITQATAGLAELAAAVYPFAVSFWER